MEKGFSTFIFCTLVLSSIGSAADGKKTTVIEAKPWDEEVSPLLADAPKQSVQSSPKKQVKKNIITPAKGNQSPSTACTQDKSNQDLCKDEKIKSASTIESANKKEKKPAIVPKFELLGHVFKPGERKRLGWSAGQSFSGNSINTPVLVINGAHKGPKLCLTAAVHGDELNGVEIVLRVVNSIEAKELHGTIIGVPIVNILGLTRNSRYLPDRRDLNRYFPGNEEGSAASRIAYLFFHKVIKHCDYLVDFHTGSGKRTNLPQLRADLENSAVYQFTKNFGATAVLHHSGNYGMLRRAAIEEGIPAVTFELGEPGTLQIKHVDYGIAAVETLMEKLKMLERFRLWSEPQPRFYESMWVRANQGGILISSTSLGAKVSKGDKLGWVNNPVNNEQTAIKAPTSGRILGMALNQFVLPGFAAYHIGVEAKKPAVVEKPVKPISEDTEQEPVPNSRKLKDLEEPQE